MKYDGLNVYLPDEIREKVVAIAKQRRTTPQKLLDRAIAKSCPAMWDVEVAIEAESILKRGGTWPTDPIRALVVGTPRR